MTTLFVLPPLITLFVLMEFNYRKETLARYFGFADNPIGRGCLLILIALMLTDVDRTIEFIFSILITVVGLLNLVLGITNTMSKHTNSSENSV
jgi:hypothetical protein